MVANIHPTTGIAYGYISAAALDSETVDSLLYGAQATNETYAEAFRENVGAEPGEDATEAERDAWEARAQDFADSWEDYESTYSGEFEGVRYRSSWLGGALNFFILESPHVTDKARLASPCVPNAAILDTLDGSKKGYDVPNDWRARHD